MNSAAYLFDLRGAVTLESPMHNFWPSCGFAQLQRNERAWLVPTDDYLRLFLARPELALVEESCPTEHALHGALQANPRCGVTPHTLESLQDADVRSNYVLFLRLRELGVDVDPTTFTVEQAVPQLRALLEGRAHA